MMDHDEAFQKLAEDAKAHQFTSTYQWVRWMRDEGYRRRMHGDLLHYSIVDAMAICADDEDARRKSA